MKKRLLSLSVLCALLSGCSSMKDVDSNSIQTLGDSVVDASYVETISDMDYDIGSNYTIKILETYDVNEELQIPAMFQEVYTEGFRFSSIDPVYEDENYYYEEEYYYFDGKICCVKNNQDNYTLEESSRYMDVTPDEMKDCFNVGKTLSSVNWSYQKRDDEGNCYFNTTETVVFSFYGGETASSSNMELKFEDKMLKTISCDCDIGFELMVHFEFEFLSVGSTSIGHELPI